MEEKRARQLGVVAPALLTKEERKWQEFKNNNGVISDPLKIYEDRKFLNTWSEPEKEIFKEKYLLHPKNFTYIAMSLERKTVMDCVQYYYQSKKKENYKQLVRKSRVRSRTRAQGAKPNSALDLANTVPGVTTRAALQAAAAQQAQQQQQPEARDEPVKMEIDQGFVFFFSGLAV
jgi:nuclear receptor co-repressor 1